MTIEVLDRVGGRPLRIPASQFIVFSDNGNPIAVGGHFGPDRSYRVAHAGDEDFNRILKAFGYGQFTVVSELVQVSAPPPGAKLLKG